MTTTASLCTATLKLFENAPDLYLLLDPEFKILTASDAYLSATHTSRENIAGRYMFDVFPDNPATPGANAVKNLHASLQRVLETKKQHSMPLQRYDVPDHTNPGKFISKYWKPVNTPVINDQGQVQYIIHKVEDVTMQQQEQQIILEEYFHLKDAQAIGHIGSFERALPESRMVWSDELYRIHGLQPQSEEITVTKFLSFVHPDDLQELEAAVAHTQATGEATNLMHRIIKATGELRHVQRRTMLLKNEAGDAVKLYGTVQDVTEHVKARQKIEENEALLHATEEAAHTGSYELDVVSGTLRFSEGLYRLFGEKPGAFTPSMDYINRRSRPEDVPAIAATLEQAVATKEPYQYTRRIYNSDGAHRELHAQGRVVCNAAGDAIKLVGLVQDITERKQAEQELRESQLLIKQVIDATLDFIMVFDLQENKVSYVNRNAYQGDDERFQETMSIGYEGILERAHPDDRIALKRFVDKFRSAADEEVHSLEYRVVTGEQTIWYRTRGKVFKRDADGKPTHYISVVQDISGIRKLEEENLQMRLSQQKAVLLAILEAQEEERYRISESLHNGVGQLLYAAKLHLERLPQFRDDAAGSEAAKSARELLSEAINETRRVSHELVPVLLSEFGLERALHDLCGMYNQSALYLNCVVNGLQERLEPYMKVALYRICQELINNIVKHSGATAATLQLNRAADKSILLQVRDNGRGFNRDEVKSGGIGLRMIEDRVKLMNGTITVTAPKTGKGTLVTIKVPFS